MSSISEIFQSLRMATVAASMDVVTITEFAAINYGATLLGPAISNAVPSGIARNLVVAGIDAATDIAKMIIFTTNTASVAAP